MHNVNSQAWVNDHSDFVELMGLDGCKTCHGLKLEGTYLTDTFAARTFQVEDNRTVKIAAGQAVSCSLCHENPLTHR
jgi:hypothetical protein